MLQDLPQVLDATVLEIPEGGLSRLLLVPNSTTRIRLPAWLDRIEAYLVQNDERVEIFEQCFTDLDGPDHKIFRGLVGIGPFRAGEHQRLLLRAFDSDGLEHVFECLAI
jgi:hypothetical protein